jgi:hypothetical protein
MARPTRIDFPDARYHVLNRGIEKRLIFRSRISVMYRRDPLAARRRRRRKPVALPVPVPAEPKTLMQLIFESQRTELDRLNEALRTKVLESLDF